MALTLGDNFSYQGAKPLDARLTYSTVAAMKAVEDSTMYNGCIAYCTEADKTYQWKSTNTVDETLGKWREYNSGGGGGTTYEAGDGIDITEDVISTKKSEAGDIDEIMDRYPTAGELVSIVNAFNKDDLYSIDEKMIGQWIDGKPLYQKTVNFGSLSNKDEKIIEHGIANIDRIVHAHALAFNPTTGSGKPLSYAYDNGGGGLAAQIGFNVTRTHIGIFNRGDNYSAFDAYVTIQYTKTTDQAVSIGEANEYSTSEKIIGTWIDGKPLYQKTIAITSGMPSSGGRTEFNHNIENVDYIVSQRARIIYPESMVGMECDSVYIDGPDSLSNTQIVMVAVNTTKIILKNTKTLANTELYVTLQYTKTT